MTSYLTSSGVSSSTPGIIEDKEEVLCYKFPLARTLLVVERTVAVSLVARSLEGGSSLAGGENREGFALLLNMKVCGIFS